MKAKITVTLIGTLTPKDKPFEVFDTELKGLVLRIEPSGRMGYFYIYHVDGRKRRYRIGDAGKLSIDAKGKSKFESGISPDTARDVVKIKAGELVKGTDPQQAKIENRIKVERDKVSTLGHFIEKHYKSWVATKHKDAGDGAIKRLNKNFGPLYKKDMATITPFELQRWRLDRLKTGISKATINRDLTTLKAVLSKAVEMDILQTHPLRKFKQIEAADDKRVRFLSSDEESRLLLALDKRETNKRSERMRFNQWRAVRHLPPFPTLSDEEFADFLKPITLLALNTGCRRGELLALTWGNVSIAKKLLTVSAHTAKSSKTRHVPLNSVALDVLVRWQKQTSGSGAQLVFPGKSGGIMTNFQTSWENLLESAEIADFHFHDCRHHFASSLVMVGVDLNTVRELLGHSDLKMTLRYSHLAPEHTARAVERLVEKIYVSPKQAELNL